MSRNKKPRGETAFRVQDSEAALSAGFVRGAISGGL